MTLLILFPKKCRPFCTIARPFVRRRRSQVREASCRKLAAPRCADDQLGPQEKRLDFVGKCVGRRVHRVSDGFHADGPAVEHSQNRFQIFAILIVEAGKAVPWTKPEDVEYSFDPDPFQAAA